MSLCTLSWGSALAVAAYTLLGGFCWAVGELIESRLVAKGPKG